MTPETFAPPEDVLTEQELAPAPDKPLEYKMHFPEIDELEAPLEKIINELLPSLIRGDFGLLIGDDTSGRVPTLIMERVMKGIYDQHQIEHPATVFMVGSGSGHVLDRHDRQEKMEIIREELQQYKRTMTAANQPLRRVLIVTEAIMSGDSLRPLAECLRQEGLDYEIATAGLDQGKKAEEKRKSIEHKLKGPIHYGLTETPSIYRDYPVAGVERTGHARLHAHLNHHSFDTDKQHIINASRARLEEVADAILQHLQTTTKNS